MLTCSECRQPLEQPQLLVRHEISCSVHTEVAVMRKDHCLYPCELKHNDVLNDVRDLVRSISTLYYLYVPRHVALVLAVCKKPHIQQRAIRLLHRNVDVRDAVIALAQIVGAHDRSVKRLLMEHVTRENR